MLQFLVAVAMVLWIGVLYASQGLQAVILPCILLWALLFSIGMLNDGKRLASGIEVIRLFIVMPLGAWGLLHGTASEWSFSSMAIAVAFYGVVSLGLLGLASNSNTGDI
jgi:hypothetical protein